MDKTESHEKIFFGDFKECGVNPNMGSDVLLFGAFINKIQDKMPLFPSGIVTNSYGSRF